MNNPLRMLFAKQQSIPIIPQIQNKTVPISTIQKYFQYGQSMADPIFRPITSYSPYISPKQSFSSMISVYEDEPEIQFGIDFSVAVTVGTGYHFTAKTDAIANYIEQFARDINLDYIATTAGRETLGYGNSIWRYVDLYDDPKSFDIIQQLPLSSLQKIWWNGNSIDSQIHYYEFQGQKTEKLLPSELIHFRYRTSNASPLGLGMIQPLVARVQYNYNKNGTDETRQRMSIIDIKRSIQDMLHKSIRRYQRRVVYGLDEGTPQQAANAQSSLNNLDDEQDFVLGGKTTITEIGAMAQAMDTDSFEKIYSNEIIKALATPVSRLYEKGALTEASADTAKSIALMNLQGFSKQMKRNFERFIIMPWYKANPLKDANGVVIPWSATNAELNWGLEEKPEMTTADFASIVSQLAPSYKKEEMIYKFLSNAGIEVNTTGEKL